jgi:hypothetical protein
VFDQNNNFGCSFVMVWDWASHIVGRTLGLGLGRSQCWKNTQFGTGSVTLWEEHLVWDWASHILRITLGLELGRSYLGKNTQFRTGPVTLWEELLVWDWARHF